jgi:DNA repair exonuclease SbcCD ATPase subunit
MGLIIRIWNITRGLAGRLVSKFERRNPEALLELERENLRKVIGRFSDGLLSHATLVERLRQQVASGEGEVASATRRMQALIKAGETASAGRHALQLKEVTARLAESRQQFEAADATYLQLLQTRDTAIAEARAKIEQLRWQIGDLKVNRALADLQNMANAMLDSFHGPGDSLNRLQEMVTEEREKANARVRVATSGLPASRFAETEAEQRALEAEALDEYLAAHPAFSAEPRALPHLPADSGIEPDSSHRARTPSNRGDRS